MSRSDLGAARRPPPWRDVRVLRVVVQVLFLAGVVVLLWWLYVNLVSNLQQRRLRTDYRFLRQPAGFAISGSPDFRSTQPIWRAVLVGLRNTLTVSLVGIVLATVLGTIVGVLRLSSNWLVRRTASLFVEAFRNVPLLVLVLFFYLAVLQQLPGVSDALDPAGFVLSQRGLWVPWFDTHEGAAAFGWTLVAAVIAAGAVAAWRTRRFEATGEVHHRALWGAGAALGVAGVGWALLGRPVTPSLPQHAGLIVEGGLRLTIEYGALLIALVVYTSAFIAEIVRGSIQAVPKGQTEAATAVGLTALQRMRLVILPQALRVAVPPTGNEFLSLTKNSALGIAIAFPELLRITRIVIGNGQPAPQAFALMMGIYLVISLALSGVTNAANRRLQRRGA